MVSLMQDLQVLVEQQAAQGSLVVTAKDGQKYYLKSCSIEAGLHEASIYRELQPLQGRGVVKLHGTIKAKGRVFLVLDFVDFALSKGDLLDRSILERILEILEACHRQGVTLGDVKRENIRMDRGGGVWLTDFDLALSPKKKLLPPGMRIPLGAHRDLKQYLTLPNPIQWGGIVGTQLYCGIMPLLGYIPSPASDLEALWWSLLRCKAGGLPWEGLPAAAADDLKICLIGCGSATMREWQAGEVAEDLSHRMKKKSSSKVVKQGCLIEKQYPQKEFAKIGDVAWEELVAPVRELNFHTHEEDEMEACQKFKVTILQLFERLQKQPASGSLKDSPPAEEKMQRLIQSPPKGLDFSGAMKRLTMDEATVSGQAAAAASSAPLAPITGSTGEISVGSKCGKCLPMADPIGKESLPGMAEELELVSRLPVDILEVEQQEVRDLIVQRLQAGEYTVESPLEHWRQKESELAVELEEQARLELHRMLGLRTETLKRKKGSVNLSDVGEYFKHSKGTAQGFEIDMTGQIQYDAIEALRGRETDKIEKIQFYSFSGSSSLKPTQEVTVTYNHQSPPLEIVGEFVASRSPSAVRLKVAQSENTLSRLLRHPLRSFGKSMGLLVLNVGLRREGGQNELRRQLLHDYLKFPFVRCLALQGKFGLIFLSAPHLEELLLKMEHLRAAADSSERLSMLEASTSRSSSRPSDKPVSSALIKNVLAYLSQACPIREKELGLLMGAALKAAEQDDEEVVECLKCALDWRERGNWTVVRQFLEAALTYSLT